MGVVTNHPTGWVPEVRADPAWVPSQGYAQSKYVAERMLEEAPLHAVNVRICQLAGSTVNGACELHARL
jgi:thioester reductase-like protein